MLFCALRRWRTSILVAACALWLSACGGGDSAAPAPAPDPLASYRQQTLQWQACDPSVLGEGAASLITQMGERLRCASMRAPMDWSAPAHGDVQVALMRLAAGRPDVRQGALLFNPGGPGGDGLRYGLELWRAFGNGNPDSPLGSKQLRLLDEFDMVGFSPRGVGASTTLHCSTNELARRVGRAPAQLDAENLHNAAYNSRTMARACLNNPLAPHIHTEATARDMDLVRHLLGDQKLNFVGYSYGTWLGAWYASVFPERVGRLVLDSSVDFTDNFDAAFIGQVQARQRLHDAVLLPYAARHPQFFGLGSDAAQIGTQVQALQPQVQDVLYGELEEMFSSRGSAEVYLFTLNAARGLDAVLRQQPQPSQPEAVQQALQRYSFVPGQPKADDWTRNQANWLYATYRERWEEFRPKSIYLDPEAAVYRSVVCNDITGISDPQEWDAAITRAAAQAGVAFYELYTNLCPYWGGPRVAHPGIAPLRDMPLLTLQSQYDAATITENAQRFYAQLPGAWHVAVPGEYQHGLFPYADQCLDALVLDYLLEGPSLLPSARQLSCPMRPLRQDEVTLAAAGRKQAATAAVPTYRDPAWAQARIDTFKQGIDRMARP